MKDDEIILNALVEYEKNNCMYYDDEWQRRVDKLINKYKKD